MAAAILGSAVGTSCIIPDHGIVALVDCGIRWCATAEHAKALDEFDSPVDVQEPQPDGSVDWVTECVCVTPDDDLVLRAEAPVMQYDLLRNQILDAARQACLDRAITNQLDPDPPPPQDATLDVTCTEAVTTIFRDGCCKLRNDLCGGSTQSCDDDPTGGEEPGPFTPPPRDRAAWTRPAATPPRVEFPRWSRSMPRSPARAARARSASRSSTRS